MNCVLYARVSTDKQADKDLSIPAQLQAMRDYAHQHRWRVTAEFEERGVSARTADRAALQELLACVRDGKRRPNVVLVHKIDRLARNVYDHATIKALLKQHGVQLASVVENVDDSVSGQLIENIMASIAQFYSANLSEEVKKGMRQKLSKGGWPHLPPFGYVSVKNADGRGSHVEVHPRTGPIVTKAFELYATGNYSLRTLAEHLSKEGLLTRTSVPWPQSQIRRLLTNPFYAGRVVSKDVGLPGRHTPLVTLEVFGRVGTLVQRRYRDVGRQGSVHGFPLRRVAICASCRGRMTAEQHDKWGYYRCSRQSYKKERCRARFTSAARAHEDLKRVCLQIRIRQGQAQAIRQAANQLIAERDQTRQERMSALQVEREKLFAREMQLTELFTAGTLTPKAYEAQGRGIRARLGEIDAALERVPLPEAQLEDRIKKTLELATSLWDVYQALDDNRRAELLAAVFRTIVLSQEGVVGFTLRPPFDGLRAAATDTARGSSLAQTLVDALDAA